jgi:hypothetical protein
MTGYIKVDILGKSRGLKFAAPACKQIFLKAKKLQKQLGTEIDAELVPVVIYWGLWNNCFNKNEDPDFTFEDVCDWVDANLDKVELYADIFKAFYSSTVIAGNSEGEKKSQPKNSRQKKSGTS